MAYQPLPNYLRTFRRRFGFSQKEIAALLGSASGTKVSRYENCARLPNLNTVWAYEVVFRRPASELFAGTYGTIATAVQGRAQDLIDQLRLLPPQALSPDVERKLALLQSIIESKPHDTLRSHAGNHDD